MPSIEKGCKRVSVFQRDTPPSPPPTGLHTTDTSVLRTVHAMILLQTLMVRVRNTESHGSTPFVSVLDMFAGVIFSVGMIEGELRSSLALGLASNDG